MTKILVTRFSSFGDVVQAMVCLEAMQEKFPGAEIHWVCREEFRPLLEGHPLIAKVHSLARGSGLRELWQLAKTLLAQNFTHFYDAHNNARSHFLSLCFLGRRLLGHTKFVRRPKHRFLRFLLFRLRINLFPWPFVLMKSYLAPLRAWQVPQRLSRSKHIYLSDSLFADLRTRFPLPNDYIVFAPSAAWELKRWPLEQWRQLIDALPELNIVLLGGPEDRFIEDLLQGNKESRQGQLLSLAGALSYAESCALIEKARYCVGGDSGLTHVADSFRVPSSLIIGAAAFAYPAMPTTKIWDPPMPCKPCSKDGRGKCRNVVYKACLKAVEPRAIAHEIRQALQQSEDDPQKA